jgi:hypothetical protein
LNYVLRSVYKSSPYFVSLYEPSELMKVKEICVLQKRALRIVLDADKSSGERKKSSGNCKKRCSRPSAPDDQQQHQQRASGGRII